MIDLETKQNNSYIPEKWDDKDLNLLNINGEYKPKKRLSFTYKFFLFSIIIFLLAGAFVLFSFIKKGSSFSEDRIVITSSGPGSIVSGEDNKIDITISNNNNIPITEAYIMATFDSGENIDGSRNLINKEINIGDILSKSTITESFDFSIFGSEGSIKEIKPILFYKIPKSKAEFTKESNSLSIVLKSAPVIINVKVLKEIHEGYNVDFTISVKNNTKNNIKDLIVSARNPNNFIYSTSSLPPFNDTPSWIINDLSPNNKKDIIMSGKIVGNIGEAANFSFFTGLKKEDNMSSVSTNTLSNFDNYNLDIDNVYSKVEKNILITGQYLDIELSNDGFYSNNITPGQSMIIEMAYRNNTEFPIDNLKIQAKLVGDYIDMSNSSAESGYFDHKENLFIWDKNSKQEFAQIPAFGSGTIRLYIRIPNNVPNGNTLRLIVFGKGDRNSEDNVSNEQDISIDKIWNINSN